ncbi:MAG: hypothetical protein ACYCZO_12465 [Daejeonella sp.]
MFKQFIQNFSDSRIYLISSLWLFLLFFILVAIMLILMNKKHIDYMSQLPLNEDEKDNDTARPFVIASAARQSNHKSDALEIAAVVPPSQ